MSTDAGPSWKEWEQAVLASAQGSAPRTWQDVLPPRNREGLDIEAVYPGGPTLVVPSSKERPGWEMWLELPATRPAEVLGRLAALADWPLHGVRLNLAKSLDGQGVSWGVEEFSDLMARWPAAFSLGLGNRFSSSFDSDLTDLVDLVTERLDSIPSDPPKVYLGLDPLSVAFGVSPTDSAPSMGLEIETYFAPLISRLKGRPTIVPFEVDSAVVADRGADAALEVGYAVASGAAYARALMASGWSVDEAREAVRLTVSLGRDVGIQTAKVRALRLAWAMLWTGLGASPRSTTCHGRTAWRTQTVYDVENNQVRATLEALAGVVGGCSSLSIRRFDASRSVGTEFSDAAARLTLATQAILAEECGLRRVVDAAEGSAFLETLTEQIARRGWQHFQAIESAGGADSAEGAALLVARVQWTDQQRREALAAGRLPIVGVSVFPAEAERLAGELVDVDLSRDCSSSELAASDPTRWRDSGPLEEERRRCETAGREAADGSQGDKP